MENRIVTPPRIEAFTSPRSGLPVANQWRIYTEEGVWFQSYRTLIAFKPYDSDNQFGSSCIVLDENSWDHSVTTGRYRNEFLDEGIQDTRRRIKNREYVLLDLN